MFPKEIDQKQINIFSCPACESTQLEIMSTSGLCCPNCRQNYPYTNEQIFFSEAAHAEDSLDRIKTILKKFDRLYFLLILVISPVYPSVYFRLFAFLKEHSETGNLGLNLGSGNFRPSPDVINVDIMPYKNVDWIADIAKLPLKNNTVDYITNIAVLEHVPNPAVVVKEMFRVLKPNGKVFCFIPFMQGFHASPEDYNRYTSEGIKELFKEFRIEKVFTIGPTSGMLWIVQEWLALCLSFGNRRLQLLLSIAIMLLTFPLKFLDFILEKHPCAKNIASGFAIIARK